MKVLELLIADNYDVENLDAIINSLGFSHRSHFCSNKNMRPPRSARVECLPKKQGTWAMPFSSKTLHGFDMNQSFKEVFKIDGLPFFQRKPLRKIFWLWGNIFPKSIFVENVQVHEVFSRLWVKFLQVRTGFYLPSGTFWVPKTWTCSFRLGKMRRKLSGCWGILS